MVAIHSDTATPFLTAKTNTSSHGHLPGQCWALSSLPKDESESHPIQCQLSLQASAGSMGESWPQLTEDPGEESHRDGERA